MLGTLKVVLPLLRNLILVGTVFNLSDAFLPWIIFSESLLLLGFWPESKHQLDDFFKGALNSKIDIMGAMRQSMSGEITADTPVIFANAGFVDSAFLNLSGEFIWAIIFLALTVMIKMAGSFCRNERARRFASKLRCRWNGFFMGILPRVATITTLHMSAGGAGSIVVSVILLILIIAFWIQLFLHLRWVVAKPDAMLDRSRRVGLLGRIELRERFEFDCLEWSNVYYPLMNYTRLLLYFLVLGVSPSSVYFSYAGPILSQLLILMIEVSSPGYNKRRDRVLYPIQNFLLMLAHIGKLISTQPSSLLCSDSLSPKKGPASSESQCCQLCFSSSSCPWLSSLPWTQFGRQRTGGMCPRKTRVSKLSPTIPSTNPLKKLRMSVRWPSPSRPSIPNSK